MRKFFLVKSNIFKTQQQHACKGFVWESRIHSRVFSCFIRRYFHDFRMTSDRSFSYSTKDCGASYSIEWRKSFFRGAKRMGFQLLATLPFTQKMPKRIRPLK